MLIREKDKKELTNIFNSIMSHFEVWAYGSRVNGKAHLGSDLDLVIRTENLEKLPLSELSSIIHKIENSNIPIIVQLHDWARLPDYFHKSILENYEVFYKN